MSRHLKHWFNVIYSPTMLELAPTTEVLYTTKYKNARYSLPSSSIGLHKIFITMMNTIRIKSAALLSLASEYQTLNLFELGTACTKDTFDISFDFKRSTD